MWALVLSHNVGEFSSLEPCTVFQDIPSFSLTNNLLGATARRLNVQDVVDGIRDLLELLAKNLVF